MNETRAETFARLKALLLAPPDDDIPLPSIVGAVEFRREQYGLNQSAWAALLGVSRGHYSDFVHGKRGMSMETRSRAFLLGVPAEALLQPSRPIRIVRVHIPREPKARRPKMTPDELRAYNREAKRRSRERQKKAEEVFDGH